MHPQPAPHHPDLEAPAVRREVVIDAPVVAVWARLADGPGLSGWLADEVDLDVRPGAVGTVRDGDGAPRPVRVDELREGRGLALVWRDAHGRETLVDLHLTPVPAGDGEGDAVRVGDRGGDGNGHADEDGVDGADGGERTRVVVVEVPLDVVSRASAVGERVLRTSGGGGAAPSASGPVAVLCR